MPKLTIGGTVIEGVREAHVKIEHQNPKAPDPIPVMAWDVTLRLQYEDLISKWALAKQGPDRFKRCELVIYHSNLDVAHTWTLPNAYVHNYEEVEHPGEVGGGAGEGGYYLNVVIRGQVLEAKDYTGENVMTVAKGTERSLPG